jgi:hypothetical protein
MPLIKTREAASKKNHGLSMSILMARTQQEVMTEPSVMIVNTRTIVRTIMSMPDAAKPEKRLKIIVIMSC